MIKTKNIGHPGEVNKNTNKPILAKCKGWTRAKISCIFKEEPENSDDEQYSEEFAAQRLSESPEPLQRTLMVSFLGENSELD
jgi:hypothetical protein